MLKIREIEEADLAELFELYSELHNNPVPLVDDRIREIWAGILKDKHYHIIVGCIGGKIVASCVLIVVPNLTHEQRPYALVENVVTSESYRNRGYATSVLKEAKRIAQQENCYKIMLMTGSKEESTLSFYEKAGYNRRDKTAFIQWL